MGLFRYLRRKLSTQQLRELGEGISDRTGQILENQQELKKKADQAVAEQQEVLKNTGLTLAGQKELKELSSGISSKADLTLQNQQKLSQISGETASGVDQGLKSLQELKETGKGITSRADQALAGQRELAGKAEQAIKDHQELKETAAGVSYKVGQVLAGQEEIDKKADQAIKDHQELKAAADGTASKVGQVLASQQQLKEISDVISSKADKALALHRVLGEKAERYADEQHEQRKKLDESLAAQKQLQESAEGISSKAEQSLAVLQELKQKADQSLAAGLKLQETAAGILTKTDQAASAQKHLQETADSISSEAVELRTLLEELAKNSDKSLSLLQLKEAADVISSKADQAIAAQHELNAINEALSSKADQALSGGILLEKKVDQALQEVQQLKADLQKVLQSLEQIRRASTDGSRYSSEAVWGELFNQVSYGSTWLKDRRFAAGRWAVGYQYLYAVYRILDEIHPKNILELGLGQSTKLISQYAAAYPEVHHRVVEHDPEWMDFFRRNYALPSNTEMVRLDWDFIPYKEADRVRVFRDFAGKFKDQKFDFISIDAPFGGDMRQYARIDVLRMLPDCLADSFIIIIDDAERSGETHTVKEMSEALKSAHIPFAMGRYNGKKDCMVICSEDLKFVCSM